SLKTIAELNPRVIALEAAYPNEKVDSYDVTHNTAYNSYQSLQSGQLFTPPPFVESSPSVAPATESIAPSSEPAASVSPSESPTQSPELTTTPEATIEATATPEPSTIPSDTPS